jgi:tryptophan-rich sensory protein
MTIRVILFLVINFSALGLGSWLMDGGSTGAWYQNLDRAPWTPPGWVFGAAWTTIMICFAVYMAIAWNKVPVRNTLLGLFLMQWVLNVLWNPVFFKYHQVFSGLIIIILLTLLVGFILAKYWLALGNRSLLLVPYFLWLLIATSLNGYILFNN